MREGKGLSQPPCMIPGDDLLSPVRRTTIGRKSHIFVSGTGICISRLKKRVIKRLKILKNN
jgi:hypothetical protein